MKTFNNAVDSMFNTLDDVRVKAIATINDMLKENKIDTININPYVVEGYITGYTFYSCDKNGYGIAYNIDSIEFIDNGTMVGICANMSDNDGEYYDTWRYSDFNVIELCWLMDMLNSLFTMIDLHNLPLLKADETFEDYEEE